MPFTVSATSIKYFFQYRCERQLRYRMTPRSALVAVPVELAPNDEDAWSKIGHEFEERVVSSLAATHQVRRSSGGPRLSPEETLEFLRRAEPERFAHQLQLEFPPIERVAESWRHRWGLPADVQLSPGFPDLVEVARCDDGLIGFRLIDIKAVQSATLFHRVQVAYYALLLETMLAAYDIRVPVLPEAQIWHADPAGGASYRKAPFRLAGYKDQVADFLRRVVPRVAAVPLGPDRDETRFHVYFKCEQCPFLRHCGKTVAPTLLPEKLNLSAVPGLSASTKYLLEDGLHIHSVAELAAHPAEGDPGLSPEAALRRHPLANWALRFSGDALVRRARAMSRNEVSRLPHRYTHQMPGTFDVGIYLVIDQDPVDGRLAAIGCRCEWPGRPPQIVIEAIAIAGPEAESQAVSRILGTVIATLSAADSHNACGAASSVRTHIFLYEPSEAVDLAAALGRHLDNLDVRRGLLHMLRMFPPDDVPPEPQYKGAQHLPATALRSVVDGLFALPVRVSHDLRSVTEALAATTPPLEDPYRPAELFARPFSSRLNIKACRELKAGRLAASEVVADLDARLRAMSSLAAWLSARNAEPGGGFLRLRKEPFRWQASFNPLAATDLELLRAHEQLQLRTSELKALVALAEPWQIRRDRQRCFARLQLLKAVRDPSSGKLRSLRFTVPPESRRAELTEGAVGLILTNDDPDLRLDVRAWKSVFVRLGHITRKDDGVELAVEVDQSGPIWDRLLSTTPADGWFLDQAFRDLTATRMDAFLQYLGSSAVPGPGRTE